MSIRRALVRQLSARRFSGDGARRLAPGGFRTCAFRSWAGDADRLVQEPALKTYHLLPSVRGDLLHKLGRYEEARVAFEAAVALAGNKRERDLLKRRAAEAAGAAMSS